VLCVLHLAVEPLATCDQWYEQDQILKTKTNTRTTRPRPEWQDQDRAFVPRLFCILSKNPTTRCNFTKSYYTLTNSYNTLCVAKDDILGPEYTQNLTASGGLRPPGSLPGLCPWTALGESPRPPASPPLMSGINRRHCIQRRLRLKLCTNNNAVYRPSRCLKKYFFTLDCSKSWSCLSIRPKLQDQD